MNIFDKYLDRELSPGFVSLYTSKMITQVAYGIGSLFLPIFLYKAFNFDFRYVVFYYAINILLYVLTVAWGAQFLNKIGFRRSLRMSVVFGALFYAVFYFIDESNIKFLMILPILIITFFRLSYWLPYHVDFAKFTSKKNRGKEFSVLASARLLISVVSPIATGFIIDQFSFDAMFVMGAIIYLMSGIPLITIPRTKEKFSWGYLQTWKEFFSKKNRKIVFAYFADGAEQVVGVIIWPIFIWELLKGDIFQVGVISTMIVGVSVVLQLTVGKYTDKMDKRKMLHFGSFFYSLGWIAKIFVITSFQIFITATYHNLAKIFVRTPFDVLTYEIAADEGHYVDEFTVLHEMAVGLGKISMLLMALIVWTFFSIQLTFILGAVAALSFNFLEFRKIGSR